MARTKVPLTPYKYAERIARILMLSHNKHAVVKRFGRRKYVGRVWLAASSMQPGQEDPGPYFFNVLYEDMDVENLTTREVEALNVHMDALSPVKRAAYDKIAPPGDYRTRSIQDLRQWADDMRLNRTYQRAQVARMRASNCN